MSESGKINSCFDGKPRTGFVLLVTLVVLVALSSLGYVLTSKLLQTRSRNQYLIDYTQARYACDSAVKYSLAALSIFKGDLISRPNEPDFSDLFNLDEQQYKDFVLQWTEFLEQQKDETSSRPQKTAADFSLNDTRSLMKLLTGKEPDDSNTGGPLKAPLFVEEPGDNDAPIVIRGPYGPSWPHVLNAIEIEIGTAKVTVEFEDENAKYPIGLALLSDEKVARESEASLQTFLRWMWNRIETQDTIDVSIERVKKQLEQIKEIKQFATEFKAITTTELQTTPAPATRAQPATPARSGASVRGGPPSIPSGSASARTAAPRTTTVRRTISVAEQKARQTSDFALIFHSSLIDRDFLARKSIQSETRSESALKYISLWADTKVNINSAPRQVLEAVFTFGGRAKEIADEIILKRRIKPFASIDELKKELFAYSDSVERCKNYIATESTFFTVKITALSGAAKVSSVIAVSREGNQTRRIAIVEG